jgi:hypothetical protein
MTLGRPTSGGRDDLPGPTATTDFPDHPTLVEIARRQTQIEVWEALSVGGYRFAKPGTIISFLLIVVSVFLIVTPVPPNWPWNVPLSIATIFAAVVMVVCGLLWLDKPQVGSPPEPLEIVPFSRAENLHLMNDQAPEQYCAFCSCPGCGDEATHLVRRPADDEPEWATVTRHCRVCDREWAQA